MTWPGPPRQCTNAQGQAVAWSHSSCHLDVGMQLLDTGQMQLRWAAHLRQARESFSPCRRAQGVALVALDRISGRLRRRRPALSSLLPVPSQARLPVVGLLHKAWLLLQRLGHWGRPMRVSVLLLAG